MNWDEVRELVPLYALGALDAETARAVEASLRKASLEQQREIADLREIAALLPYALPQTPPPAHLREQLLDRLVSESQGTPIETARAEPSLEPSAPPAERKVLPFDAPRRAESKATRWLLMAAMVVLSLTSAYLFWQNTRLWSQRGRFNEEIDSLQRQLTSVFSPATKIILMTGDEAPQANARIFWDTKTQKWQVHIFDLPAPPSDKEYQLWYVTKDAPISAAVFSTDAQGRAAFDLTLPPEALKGLNATAVTLEPKGGSRLPTSKLYLKAAI